jgi:hypothetical protein
LRFEEPKSEALTELRPHPTGSEPVAGVVEGIGMFEGGWVVTVELGVSGKGKT